MKPDHRPEQSPWSWSRLLLAHHRPTDLHHCYALRHKTTEPVYVCARCVGLYPAMVISMVVTFELEPSLRTVHVLMAILCAIPLIDWALVRLKFWRGHNPVRTLTGALGGAGLGLAMPAYFRDPGDLLFWAIIGGLTLVALIVEVGARLGNRGP